MIIVYRNRKDDLPTPPGFNPTVGQSHMEVTMDTDQSHLILKKSWDIALGPIKQVCFARNQCHSIQKHFTNDQFFFFFHFFRYQ